MLENNIDLALIQEPYLHNNRVALFPINFQVLQSNNKPKTAIVLNPLKVKIMKLEKYTNDLQVWAQIIHNNNLLHVCSSYMPPSEPIEQTINNLNESIHEIIPKMLIISSDTNAKSKLWFSSINNRRGDEIIEFVTNNNLLIMNNSNTPTFQSSFGSSSIDLTIVNSNVHQLIDNWKIETIETNSDHSYITFELNTDVTPLLTSAVTRIDHQINQIVFQQIDNKYNTKSLDINSFEKIKNNLIEIKTKLQTVHTHSELEIIVTDLMESVIKTCNDSTPRHKIFKNSNKWWTKELSQKRKLVNHLRRVYQRTRDQILRIERKNIYYNHRKQYSDLIKSCKTESWKRFCFESNTWGLPYKLINNKIKVENSIPNFLKANGQYTQTQEESLQYAFDHMFPSDDTLI
jgi:hypothetical protein